MALEFKKCKTCGRIFQGFGLRCPDCIEEEERQFTMVKDYIWEHPGASMHELVENTGVDAKLVLRFLKEGRLEMDTADGLLVCEKCGAPITSGTMCAKCKEKLSKAMDSVLPKSQAPQPKSSGDNPFSNAMRADKLHVNVRR